MPEQPLKGVSTHEQFEALCALSAGGLLEGQEFLDFQMHMKECPECREDHQDLHRLVTRELPQVQSSLRQKVTELRVKPLPYSRQRFLRRARVEGIVFSPEVEATSRPTPWYSRPVALLAPIAALIFVAIGLAVYHFRATPEIANGNGVAAGQRIAELQRENAALSAQLKESVAMQQRENNNLRAQLERATTTEENLRRNSDQARGEAARVSSRNTQLLEEFRNQEKLLADAKDEAARSSQLRTNDEASLVEQQTRITELSNKLRIASATLDVERQLVAAGKDIPELMAARQLHVIDVRDTDPNGNPTQAFGRVFLTEGKSLTFYAFDLHEDRVANAKRSFQVWAVPEEGKNSPRSLGFLRVDRKAQGRWVLKVENPDLVKAISSVFVTVEPASGGNQPHGEKMLYAYLGEANHP